MRRIHCCTLFILLCLSAWPVSADEYWQQQVDYKMHAVLDDVHHVVSGYSEITYFNNSPDTLHQLFFHLYPNAFCDTSVMAREAKKAGITLIPDDSYRGGLELHHIYVFQNEDRMYQVSGRNYGDDATLYCIDLPFLLYPGQHFRIQLDFVTTLWKANSKAGKGGYRPGSYVISQWYPKLCVYDENGWDLTPYHYLGEFYGEFGNYEVTVTVPYRFVVGATGLLIDGDPGWQAVALDSTLSLKEQIEDIRLKQQRLQLAENARRKRVVSFSANQVHDFVWVASCNYVYDRRDYQDVSVNFLFYKENLRDWSIQEVPAIVGKALKWLDEHIGPFPYPTLLVASNCRAEAMEYPMAILLDKFIPLRVTHEIVHMYFYAAVANNESKDGWLDEGLVTYLAETITGFMDHVIRLNAPYFERPLMPITNHDIRLNYLYYYLYSSYDKPLATPGWKFHFRRDYNLNYYIKGSAFFRALAEIMGEESFFRLLQTYYSRWKFRHVNRARFSRLCSEIYETDLEAFFAEWLDKTPEIDYSIRNKRTRRLPLGDWETMVEVERCSDGISPITVMLETKNNETIRKMWDGKKRHDTIIFRSSAQPGRVVLDPDEKILDHYYLNNSSDRFPIKLMLNPDIPNYYYQPRDRYLVTWFPHVWYNSIDGASYGFNWRSGYLNRYHLSRGQLWYGSRSDSWDVLFSLSEPLEGILADAWINGLFARMDGREFYDVNIVRQYRRGLFDISYASWRAGLIFHRLYDARYTKGMGWQRGTVFKSYLQVQRKYHWQNFETEIKLRIEKGISSIVGEYAFGKYTLAGITTAKSLLPNSKVKFYYFTGKRFSGRQLPIQEQFGISGAGLLKRWKYVALRSVGSLPADVSYYMSGDANIRGYGAFSYSGFAEHISACGVEWKLNRLPQLFNTDWRIPVFNRINVELFSFYDGALNGRYGYLADAGFGVGFKQHLLGRSRRIAFHFPIWINRPGYFDTSVNERSIAFRWLMELTAKF